MTSLNYAIHMAQRSVDVIFDHWPLPSPTVNELKKLRWVGHRGAAGPGPQENLLATFERISAQKIWATEFDVRMTRDLVPIVFHDPTTGRIFKGSSITIEQIDFVNLRKSLPLIPTLEEVLTLLKNKTYLMIEIKTPLDNPKAQILKDILCRYLNDDDFRLLTLHPKFFENQTVLSPRQMVYVAELAPRSASDYVAANGWGGIAGHYLLMTNRIIERHHALGQMVGAGFITSVKNGLRQSARGIDWCFTDKASVLQQDLDRLISAH